MTNREVAGAPEMRELTAFVREVLLPGSSDEKPNIDRRSCFFELACKSSPIHRWGIYACEDIPPETRVIEYTGERIDANEVVRRSIRPHLYLFWLDADKNIAIDGGIGGSGAEIINHSCSPNLITDKEDGRLFLASLRPISKGEELTLDYNLERDGATVGCSCGALNCRGTINRLETIQV